MLNEIDGLTVRLVDDALSCCGGYQGEYLFHPEQAKELIQSKLASLPIDATVLAASVDCQGQFINRRQQKTLHVLHPIQFLYILLPNIKSTPL